MDRQFLQPNGSPATAQHGELVTVPGPVPRSNRPDVRNPMVGIPEIAEGWAELPHDSQIALIGFLKFVSKFAHGQGNQLWRKNKYVSAAYWKAKGVDARHLANAGTARFIHAVKDLHLDPYEAERIRATACGDGK